DQHRFVRGEARQQLIRSLVRRQLMRGRERFAVLLHLVGTEQLRPEWRLVAKVSERFAGPGERAQSKCASDRCAAVRGHASAADRVNGRTVSTIRGVKRSAACPTREALELTLTRRRPAASRSPGYPVRVPSRPRTLLQLRQRARA